MVKKFARNITVCQDEDLLLRLSYKSARLLAGLKVEG
jgi:hypothetical protein